MNDRRITIGSVTLYHHDVSDVYQEWPAPDIIISDGAYGVSGFKGDAREPSELPDWYRRHIQAWSLAARPGATLWFWNTEIGWATVHPLLHEYGWDYVRCNIWNKGIQHRAGDCNLATLKSFPVVTEVCVQYVRRAEFFSAGKRITLKEWLRSEWTRTALPLDKANEACGVAHAAARKYLANDVMWYAPPPDRFARLVAYANDYGAPEGRPYFSFDGEHPASQEDYARLFAFFKGQYGITNVWDHPPLRDSERAKRPGSAKAAHLNQKPVALMNLIIQASSRPGDVLWEPFGGLCTAGLVALLTHRMAWCAEIDEKIFHMAAARLKTHAVTCEEQSEGIQDDQRV